MDSRPASLFFALCVGAVVSIRAKSYVIQRKTLERGILFRRFRACHLPASEKKIVDPVAGERVD
jgi:hypothetical protein